MSKRFNFAALNIALLNPKGFIAMQQKHVLIVALFLMLIVVVPAYVLLIRVGVKYRAGNTAPRQEFKHHSWLMWLWWLIPTAVISILAVHTWYSTHALDPQKPIASENPPITIQVVALQWKWLFIYPEQHIATVNFVEIPVNTPVKFELTADDATMNSFWIPQLGGQMYAMTGMSSKINLMANEVGNYDGSAAEINGQGLAGMRFVTKAVSKNDYDNWLMTAKTSSKALHAEEYMMLAKPSENNPQTLYSDVEPGLYNSIISKYMKP